MSEKTDPLERARAIEQEIAARLRDLRVSRGVSQKDLAKLIGVSFQQVQKYEKGDDRISPGKLYVSSECLEVPMDYFFDPLPYELAGRPSRERMQWYQLYDKLPKDLRRHFLDFAEHL